MHVTYCFGLFRTLKIDMKSLMDSDDMDQWRMKESQELGNLVQKRIRYIQVHMYSHRIMKLQQKRVIFMRQMCDYRNFLN